MKDIDNWVFVFHFYLFIITILLTLEKMKFLMLLSIINYASSYSWEYHSLIGSITDYHLEKDKKVVPFRQEICSIEHISPWADKVKYIPEYSWTRPYHYIDTQDSPPEYCNVNTTSSELQKGNLMKGLELFKNYTTVNDFKFFVHLYQDLYQPLHSSGIYRGGNDLDIVFLGKKTSLHSLWDSLLLKHRETNVKDYKEYLIRKFRGKMKNVNCSDFEEIMKQNNQLNCDIVYTFPKDKVIDNKYIRRSRNVVDSLVYTAGYCLAQLI